MDLKGKIESLLNDQMLGEMIEIRRHLHQYPELSFEEVRTSEFLRKKLDEWKVEYHFPVVKTGIVALIKGSQPGKRIALRSDMDALPIRETSGLEYQSKNTGVMHACGHDVHMTSLLGAIRLLDRLKEEIHGEILFVFQPGEERIPGGAKLMLEEGVFDGRKPDMIVAQHVLPEMDAGNVGFRPGIYMASSDEIYLSVEGKGGHAALPMYVNDPVLMASHILITLQQEIRRKAPSHIPTVLSFGKVVADGAVNVIPDFVNLEGTFRTMDEEWRNEAHRMMERIAKGLATSMGGTCQLEIRKGYPVLKNDEKTTLQARSLAGEFLGPSHVEELGIRMTAEDFAWFLQEIPGVMYRLGIKQPGSDEIHPLHTPGFVVEESAVRTGISLLAYIALGLLRQKAG